MILNFQKLTVPHVPQKGQIIHKKLEHKSDQEKRYNKHMNLNRKGRNAM